MLSLSILSSVDAASNEKVNAINWTLVAVFVNHPLIRKDVLEDREYQANIAGSSLRKSTLVVLPTGLGKTAIAIRIIANVLESQGGKVLVLAPTKPLVEQHTASLRESLVVKTIAMFTGEATPPQERELLWRENDVICSTPQVIRNDLHTDRISLEKVSLVVFDEAHRAVGDYAYVDIARVFKEKHDGLVLGTTASPGSNAEKILEVCSNLGISRVEIRTEFDPDVVKYVQDIDIEPVRVDVPEAGKEVAEILKKGRDECISNIRAHGFLQDSLPVTRRDLLALSDQIHARLKSNEKNFHLYKGATAVALTMKIDHALELVETQGLQAFKNYIDRAMKTATTQEASKADKQLVKNRLIKEALALASKTDVEHTKIKKILWVVRDQLFRKPDSRIIIFTHYRDTSEIVTKELAKIPGVKSVRFVGQATKGDDRGLKQKEQVEIIDKFSKGSYNVIVATSVAEEGLDIPSTDLVVFYEPVPSEIRTIQRRGRTGRRRAGRVVVLVTKDTRDEIYYYSARRKERKMHQELEKLRRNLRQRIFVSEPSGEVFTQAHPQKMIEYLRKDTSTKQDDVKMQEPHKKGQTKISEF